MPKCKNIVLGAFTTEAKAEKAVDNFCIKNNIKCCDYVMYTTLLDYDPYTE
jgi:hypothetical protein